MRSPGRRFFTDGCHRRSFALLAARWIAQVAPTRHRAGENPGDVITVLLLAAYLGLGGMAFSIGTIDWLAVGAALRIGERTVAEHELRGAILPRLRGELLPGGER